jgi:glutamyl-tRNA synthetase
MPVRTRFAPSPTGYLHIGSARTALYSWLYARAHEGTFILRIEDTDLERGTQEAVDVILKGMEWLDLTYDEGPFFQTKRLERYQEVLKQLLAEGKAYRCYCSKERLERLRKEQLKNKQKPRYDGFCRQLQREEINQPFVIRFKNPQEGVTTFEDQVRGKISIQNSELDDLILARSDGMPTYNFSVVVDDIDMKITHVIRGDDHINNTPRQINIFKALNTEPPLYAHIPMILGSDGKRLSKRHGAMSVLQYRDEGYLPEALINYLVRLGWSSGDQEIFSRDEMISLFNLSNISRSPAIFNPEKLLWLNQHYIKTTPPENLAGLLAWYLERLNVEVANGPSLTEVVLAQRERCKTLVEMAEKSRFLFEEDINYDQETIQREFSETTEHALSELLTRFSSLPLWDKQNIHDQISAVAQTFNLKMAKVAQPLRIAVTGGTVSPSIDLTLQLLGKEKTLRRLQKTIDIIEK